MIDWKSVSVLVGQLCHFDSFHLTSVFLADLFVSSVCSFTALPGVSVDECPSANDQTAECPVDAIGRWPLVKEAVLLIVYSGGLE